jgi:hypothetical protein
LICIPTGITNLRYRYQYFQIHVKKNAELFLTSIFHTGWSGEETAYLEMIELSGLTGPTTALSVCPSTGNLLIAISNQLIVFRYILAGSTTAPRPAKFIDFEVSRRPDTGTILFGSERFI